MDFAKLTYTEPPIYTGTGVRVYHGCYEGYDVAVKVLSLNAISKEEVENEFMAQRSLQHPGICAALGLGWKEGEAWMLLEWQQGDLAQEITRRRLAQEFWTAAELWQHFTFLLEVFSFAQEQGISHRDIKPPNIFLAKDGSLKVGDFGTAKCVGMEETDTLKGSPYYMSPELKQKYRQSLRFQPSGCYNAYRSDVYSLGLTFLHMILLTSSPELLVADHLQDVTDHLLSQLPSEFQPLLALMLKVHQRMDFLELRAWSQQGQSSVLQPQLLLCRLCGGTVQELVQDWTGSFCSQDCFAYWHRLYQQNLPFNLRLKIHNSQPQVPQTSLQS